MKPAPDLILALPFSDGARFHGIGSETLLCLTAADLERNGCALHPP